MIGPLSYCLCCFLRNTSLLLPCQPSYLQGEVRGQEGHIPKDTKKLHILTISDVHMNEALVVSVDPSKWHPWFKEKGSRNVSSVCFKLLLNRELHLEGSTDTTNAS